MWGGVCTCVCVCEYGAVCLFALVKMKIEKHHVLQWKRRPNAEEQKIILRKL